MPQTLRVFLIAVFSCAFSFGQAVRFDTNITTVNSGCAAGKQCPISSLPGTIVSFCSGQSQSVVNTSGTTVTWVSGVQFSLSQTGTINIAGLPYTIRSVASVTSLTITASAGTQTGAIFSSLTSCLASPATTYTTYTAGTACSTTAQLTPQTGGACLPTADLEGNAGGWFLPGQYSYYLRVPSTAGGGTYGPYPINVGAQNGCPSGATCDANYTTLALGCTAAGSGTLYITKAWNGLTTQSLTCVPTFLGNGVLKPASGQTVTLPANTICPVNQACYDITAGGAVTFATSPGIAYPRNWGATCVGSGHDDSPAFRAAATALGASGGTVVVQESTTFCFVSTGVTDNNTPIMWRGFGSGSTVKGNGITMFTAQSPFTSFYDFTIKASGNSAATVGVYLFASTTTQVNNTFSGMTISGFGTNSTVGDLVGTGVKVKAAIFGQFTNSVIGNWDIGVGFYNDGTYTPPVTYGPPDSWNFFGGEIRYCNKGVFIEGSAAFSTLYFIHGTSFYGNNISAHMANTGTLTVDGVRSENFYGANPTGFLADYASVITHGGQMFENTSGGSGTARNIKISATNVSGYSASYGTTFSAAGIDNAGTNCFIAYDAAFNGTNSGCVTKPGGFGGSPLVLGTRTISTTSPITGGGDLTANRTIACATCATQSMLDLQGTSSAIGGTLVAAGACITTTVAVTGAATGMVAKATPNSAAMFNAGFRWDNTVITAANVVSLAVCNTTAGGLTPSSTTYSVRVTQ